MGLQTNEFSLDKFRKKCEKNNLTHITKFVFDPNSPKKNNEHEKMLDWLYEEVGKNQCNVSVCSDLYQTKYLIVIYVGFRNENDASLAMLTWDGTTKFTD